MERSTPVRKPHTSTADLLTWMEAPPPDPSAMDGASSARPTIRTHQPAGGISSVLFGGQMTPEEAESLLKRKPCSGFKLREMTGSGIFAGDGENGDLESGSAASANKTGLRIYQQAAGAISQISFSTEESVSPKKPTSIPEVAKQRELSGNLESESEMKIKKQLSDAKTKELSGHDIFGPPPEISPSPLAARSQELKESKDIEELAPRNPAGGQSNLMFSEETVVKTAKKIHNQKFAELTGNDIFKGDTAPGSAEKPLSVAKLREMSGSDIFADGKAQSRDYLGGVRKPPGGESSIALV
ncbi:uncharacterized protein LOC18423843 isoform X2 [Amborella trichopoda]|uniref:uncharacterized protein LOC18423843 isoform X2 n=1 Tax=Amborella trichopoda TaxID=13333 RepID=UPI0005D416B5|nr:uncharacterized protein LOC18423843 isoform X2 [Amborella trichopoda]|eukprot:XP_011628163.1 uncharacterized protein LOC18423843 isoform X2 [Amborella trichopoda]